MHSRNMCVCARANDHKRYPHIWNARCSHLTVYDAGDIHTRGIPTSGCTVVRALWITSLDLVHALCVLLGFPIPAGGPTLLNLVDADVEERLNLIPTDGALVRLVLQGAGTAVAHAHVTARQGRGVAACGHADHTLIPVCIIRAVVHCCTAILLHAKYFLWAVKGTNILVIMCATAQLCDAST